jgi:hypothetical protein
MFLVVSRDEKASWYKGNRSKIDSGRRFLFQGDCGILIAISEIVKAGYVFCEMRSKFIRRRELTSINHREIFPVKSNFHMF